MNITLNKTTSPAAPPKIKAPPSKSDAHRLLICAALSRTDTPITLHLNDSNADIDATVSCLSALGADIRKTDTGLCVIPIDRTVTSAAECRMDVGESGSTLRFLLPVIGSLGKNARIRMHGRLPDRPLSPLDTVLTAHGMTLSRDTDDTAVLHVSGQLTAGEFTIDGSISSQFISGLLFALPLLPHPSDLHITGSIASAPYIALTRTALSRFGVTPECTDDGHHYRITHTPPAPCENPITVEGDWSGAAFLLCAGAMSHSGVTVTGLSPASPQGDRRILDILSMTGCDIRWDARDGVTLTPPADSVLKPFCVHADDIPDLVPPLASLAAACRGESIITGCARLKLKESDRLAAVAAMIDSLGGTVTFDDDTIRITGNEYLAGGSADGANDHRMVMSAALCTLIADRSVTVSDGEAIRKSYPAFFDDLRHFHITQKEVLPWQASLETV